MNTDYFVLLSEKKEVARDNNGYAVTNKTSISAYEIPDLGCIVRTSTTFNGSHSEALVFVPNSCLKNDESYWVLEKR